MLDTAAESRPHSIYTHARLYLQAPLARYLPRQHRHTATNKTSRAPTIRLKIFDCTAIPLQPSHIKKDKQSSRIHFFPSSSASTAATDKRPSEGAETNGEKFPSYLQNLNRTLNTTAFQGSVRATFASTQICTQLYKVCYTFRTGHRKTNSTNPPQRTTFEHFLNVHFPWNICAGFCDSTGPFGGAAAHFVANLSATQTSVGGLCPEHCLHCSQKNPCTGHQGSARGMPSCF